MLVRVPGVSYVLCDGFRWELPPDLNMGVLCADRHPALARALIEQRPDGSRQERTFGELATLSNRLANALAGLGIAKGDRVAIVLPQRLETGVAHLAIDKMGAIAVPLSGLFGPDALRYRLGDSGARIVITDAAHRDAVAAVAAELDELRLIVVDGVQPPHHGFWELIESVPERFEPVATGPDTPALIIYTSGTTGPPKGALHGHRVLFGHLPGFELSHDFFPQEGDVFWTPADWAWIGGLMDALMPTWFHGRPIVAAPRDKFDPVWAMQLMADLEVRNVFFPPTVLKLMRQADLSQTTARPRLRSVMCGGEPLGDEMLAWARRQFGVDVNEIYGQTEANYVIGNSSRVWDVRPGSMGRPYPGHEVAVIDEDGEPVGPRTVGQIAVRAPDPVMFLEYWDVRTSRARSTRTRATGCSPATWRTSTTTATSGSPHATTTSLIPPGTASAPPRLRRACLLHHPAVAMAAAIGVPDPVRGEAVKAFIQLAEGHDASDHLEREIQDLVRSRLAAYVYPRHIEFVAQMPMTTTGKIQRTELRKLQARVRRRRADPSLHRGEFSRPRRARWPAQHAHERDAAPDSWAGWPRSRPPGARVAGCGNDGSASLRRGRRRPRQGPDRRRRRP